MINGFDDVMNAGKQLFEPAARAADIGVDAMGTLVEAQLRLADAWVSAGAAQCKAVADGDWQDSSAMSALQDAGNGYAETLRATATETGTALQALGRETVQGWTQQFDDLKAGAQASV
ncbi:hypothetical protein [Spectribacter hydrogenoxidans]|uniref:Phasin protein n=1 Tax=Spectribacter hydrogenoxidans TaxID=3075608 RepID=A0ABU3BWZ9_9GAMM|nr:hypothetical protein [Salinisphaera sp. W335]MDT0633824.1 hypothetical protein [Salinisphaera sp. W335]